jgi:hypothetical protein
MSEKLNIRSLGQKLGPVRTVDDLRMRCAVCELTDCWVWLGGKSSDGLGRISYDGKVRGILAVAASVSGRTPKPGQVAYPKCPTSNCCNPEHVRVGTRAQKGAFDTRSGRLRGNPTKRASSLLDAMKRRALTPEQVAEVCESNETLSAAAKRLGVGKTTILNARQGRYTLGVKGSSVFAWGGS